MNTQVTPFSHPAGHPGVLRRHARGGLALAQVSGLVEREPGADLVVRVIAQYLPRELEPRQCQPGLVPIAISAC